LCVGGPSPAPPQETSGLSSVGKHLYQGQDQSSHHPDPSLYNRQDSATSRQDSTYSRHESLQIYVDKKNNLEDNPFPNAREKTQNKIISDLQIILYTTWMVNVTHFNYVSVSAAILPVTDQINIDKLVETAINIPCFNGKNFKMFFAF
jgi:hypothetical protein